MSSRSFEIWNILSINQPVVIFSHEFSLISAVSFLVWLALTTSWATSQLLSSSPRQQVNVKQQKQQREHTLKLTISQIITAALLFILASELPIHLTTPTEGLFDLITGTDPLLADIIARVPSLLSGPSPPLLLRNRHVQFIPFVLQNYWHMKVDPLPYQRVHFTVSDCIDKTKKRYDDYYCDEMLNDTVTIDIFPPFDSHDEQSHLYRGFNRSSPIILYAPGLKCHSQDLPGTSIVRRAYEAGFRSIVVRSQSTRTHTQFQIIKSSMEFIR